MLDFTPVRERKMTMAQLVEGLTIEDLADLTNEMVDKMVDLIDGCTDADVVFEPEDPDADDPYAVDESERNISWNLGHIVVHTTASAEESAFLAAELARGVDFHGRSRFEIPWREVTTIRQCYDRLEESRRMRLASLNMWPNEPYLDNTYRSRPDGPEINAFSRFVRGLSHDESHLDQIEKVVRQAKAARSQLSSI